MSDNPTVNQEYDPNLPQGNKNLQHIKVNNINQMNNEYTATKGMLSPDNLNRSQRIRDKYSGNGSASRSRDNSSGAMMSNASKTRQSVNSLSAKRGNKKYG